MRATLLVVTALVSGCASAPTGTPISVAPTPTVISVADKAVDSLMYYGVEVRVAGSTIGGHYDGLLKVYQWAIQPNTEIEAAWTAWMQNIGLDMLRGAGYKVKETSQIFGRAQSVGNVRYALAGRLTGIEFDTYGTLAGNKSTASLQVAFELFDNKQREVVHKTQLNATATTAGTSGASVELAFRNIFASLLADRSFVNAISSSPTAHLAAADPAVKWNRNLPNETDIVTITGAETNILKTGSVFDRNAPAVVSITGPIGGGTAFILTRDGLALTNHHVIEGQSRLTARFRDGRNAAVRVIRSNKDADVALIQVDCGDPCATVDIGDDSTVDVGSDAFIIGTPLGVALTHTLTKGVISGRRLLRGVTLLQTDAAVNPGNSGGPILSASTGKVLAVTSAKLVGPDLEGLGFGIAITDALRILGVRLAR